MGFRVSFRKHRQKDGGTILYARYKEPYRTEEGTVRSRSVERSTGTGKRLEAKRWAEAEYQKAHDEAHRPRDGENLKDTFASAALSYLKNKGSRVTPIDGLIPADRLKMRANKKYLIPLIERIGTKKLTEIDQKVVDKLATQLYSGCMASTIDRQLYTPIIAVMHFARHTPQLKRPAGHDILSELDVPTENWYPAVLRAGNPYLIAFLITQRLTGRRPGELLNRTREHYDDDQGTLLIYDGKGKQFILVQLPEPALIAIRALPDLRLAEKGSHKAGERLTHAKRHFLFGTNQKTTMRNWLVDACKEAGVRYHMPKEAGRHAWTTGHLAEGKSLKWVMDGQRWKTITMPAVKYGHLEKQEVDRQARESVEAWFKKILSQPIEIESADAPKLIAENGDKRGDGKKKRA